jgi:hypothetical protein
MSAAAFDHVRQHGPHAVNQAPHVDVHRRPADCVVLGEEVTHRHHSGVVHEDVDAAMAGNHRVHEPAERVAGRDVKDVGVR